MDLLENLQKYFEKSKLFEMAYDRKKVIDKFQDKNEERIYHLLYIFFFRDNESLNHWINEVIAFSKMSYRVKPKNKLMNSCTIYDLIWLQPKDMINKKNILRFLNIANKSKGLNKIEKYSFTNLNNFLEEFFKQLSDELSKYDLVDNIEYKIKELLNKYSIN